jgi:anaerobic selenocysteine-containing dehydrogenase
MGFTDQYWQMSDDEMLTEFYDWNAPALEGITLEKLKEKGYMRLNVGAPDQRAPHAEGNFKTPSGKCEFKASAAAGGNFVVPVWRSMYEGMQPGEPVDPLPDYVAPFESPESNPELAKRYPLNIVSPKPHAFLNTQYGNELVKRHRQGEQAVVMHPEDALARNVTAGNYVRVFNDRGSFEGLVRISPDVMPGLVMANVGYWPSLNRTGTSVNAISADRHATLGQAGAYSDNLVEVELVRVAREIVLDGTSELVGAGDS